MYKFMKCNMLGSSGILMERLLGDKEQTHRQPSDVNCLLRCVPKKIDV